MRLLPGLKSVFLGTVCAITVATAVFAQTINFDIGAGDLKTALDAYIRQSGVQLIYRVDEIRGLSTRGTHGTLLPDAALQQLLQGTGLVVHQDTSGALVVAREVPSKNAEAASNEAALTSGDVETVVVTGSRIPRTGGGPQHVSAYTAKDIHQSGQTTVADFLNTIPSVSTAIGENGFQNGTSVGGTTVQLRGLPIGTTLVLLNGRRLQTSGSQAFGNFFDLNFIPLAAIARIDVMAEGASAVYGSDAIAGVVNIITKKDIEGFSVDYKYGAASGTDENNVSVSWGTNWDRGYASMIASYQTRSALLADERAISADNDYTRFGGPNRDFPLCDPGNVFSTSGGNLPGLNAPFAGVPKGFSGQPSIQEFQSTAGTLNTCSALLGSTTIPGTHRADVFVQAGYNITPSVEVFVEMLYAHTEQFIRNGYWYLFGVPGFQQFTAPAANPYNPFGATVGVTALFTTAPIQSLPQENFFQPVVGARGTFWDDWRWELSGSEAIDSNDQTNRNWFFNNAKAQAALNSTDPSTALNPFVAGPIGPQSLIKSFFSDLRLAQIGNAWLANGYVDGPIADIGPGPIDVVLGAEYSHDTLSTNDITDGNVRTRRKRESYATFAEIHIPIIANHENPQQGDVLAVSLAGRYDHYSDFGSAWTSQIGAEWRPIEELLFRATYADAFKAPSLNDLYSPHFTTPVFVNDPSSGLSYVTEVVTGGNPGLRAETGRSHTFGAVYTGGGLEGSITNWDITLENAIQGIPFQTIVDNPSLFPGRVTRDASGQIVHIDDLTVNFGQIHVAGIDYQLSYRYESTFGAWTPSIEASEVYQYDASLAPGTPPSNGLAIAQDSGNWSPRWKITTALNWSTGPYAFHVDGRYVGTYQDYDSTRTIGNFWLFDANLRYEIGQALLSQAGLVDEAYLEVGAVNAFDALPQFSNFGFGFHGFDPTQADIRGRFLYVRLGTRI